MYCRAAQFIVINDLFHQLAVNRPTYWAHASNSSRVFYEWTWAVVYLRHCRPDRAIALLTGSGGRDRQPPRAPAGWPGNSMCVIVGFRRITTSSERRNACPCLRLPVCLTVCLVVIWANSYRASARSDLSVSADIAYFCV